MSRYMKLTTTLLLFAALLGCGKSYEGLVGMFENPDNPYTYIGLDEDGSCAFTFAYAKLVDDELVLGGVCATKGTYDIEGEKLTILISEAESMEYVPVNPKEAFDVLEHTFTIVDENTIQIDNAVLGTPEGASFVRIE